MYMSWRHTQIRVTVHVYRLVDEQEHMLNVS